MDPATEGVLVAGAIGVGGFLSWLANKIWGARGAQDSIAKSVETLGLAMTAKIETLGLTMKAEVQGVMTETKLQTQTINTIAANLARVETNQRSHEQADEARFKEAFNDHQRTHYETQTMGTAVKLLEQEVDQLQDVSKLRHQEEIRALEESKRRRQLSPLPFPASRDPRKDPSDR